MRETVSATALGAIALKTRTTISDRKIFCILGSKGDPARRLASPRRVFGAMLHNDNGIVMQLRRRNTPLRRLSPKIAAAGAQESADLRRKLLLLARRRPRSQCPPMG